MELINSEHVKFLRPLSDWRILDLYSLTELAQDQRFNNVESVRKLIQRLIKKGVVKSYRDPWSRRIYLYLTALGQKYIDPDLASNLKEDQLYHDINVTLLGLKLIELDKVVKSIELEHKIQNRNRMRSLGDFIPDAKIVGTFKGKNFVGAIELELTQKEKSRIIAKAEEYQKSNFYDVVFFFFPDKTLLNRYKEILDEAFGNGFNNRIFLFVFDTKNRKIATNGWAMSRSQSLFELFEIDSLAPE